MYPQRIIGQKTICPICNKEFVVSEDTTEIMHNRYVCSWTCFNAEVKRRLAEKNNAPENDKKRGKNNDNFEDKNVPENTSKNAQKNDIKQGEKTGQKRGRGRPKKS